MSKMKAKRNLMSTVILLAVYGLSVFVSTAQAQTTRWDTLANLPFPNDYPTK